MKLNEKKLNTRTKSILIAASLMIIMFFLFKIGSKDSELEDPKVVFEDTTAEDAAQNAAAGEEPVVETAIEGMMAESTPDTTVLSKKEGTKEGYLNRCVFLGDSRTVAMVNYGFFNDDAALAQIGISHPSFASNTFINNAGKEYTLKSYLGSHQAPVIYILLGVNGINHYSESDYKNPFLALIDRVAEMAPNSNIVLVAIGPVDDNGIYKNDVKNAWIDKYNDFLLETAKAKHIFYLDITEILKGSDGQVKSEYNSGDGLHYSVEGCKAIFRYIVEHPVPGISDEGEYVVKYIKPDPNRIKVTMDDGSEINEDMLNDLMDMMMEPAETEDVSDTDTQDNEKTEEELRKEEGEKEKAEDEESEKEEEGEETEEVVDEEKHEEVSENEDSSGQSEGEAEHISGEE